MTPLLPTEGLTRTYESDRGVTDVEFSLDRGERLVVLGHNGAGKSTLLELVATLRKPTRGTVCIDGLDAARDPRGARRLLALAPQTNALDPTAAAFAHARRTR
ncbi:ATP-binding cassette domain-containing protein [Mumia quercus]|uniref:ATP-binding cassette domain-containing protein n=1 Tax=Mumia quercus TaxID=2976125 RepID=UPI0021D16A99|nr:ATP-binding cassette domain-containing protein [Mumia quercus]